MNLDFKQRYKYKEWKYKGISTIPVFVWTELVSFWINVFPNIKTVTKGRGFLSECVVYSNSFSYIKRNVETYCTKNNTEQE